MTAIRVLLRPADVAGTKNENENEKEKENENEKEKEKVCPVTGLRPPDDRPTFADARPDVRRATAAGTHLPLAPVTRRVAATAVDRGSSDCRLSCPPATSAPSTASRSKPPLCRAAESR